MRRIVRPSASLLSGGITPPIVPSRTIPPVTPLTSLRVVQSQSPVWVRTVSVATVMPASVMPSSAIPIQSVAFTAATMKAVPASPFRDVTLNEILATKHARLGDITAVSEDDTVFSAIATMERLGIGAVLVKNQENQYTGIFSERDYMRKIALKGLSSRNTPVKAVMTPQPVIVPSSATATSVMELMTKKRFRHVPVRHDASGEVIGIISIGDILATVLREYKEHVSFMTDMVHGRYPA